MFIFSSLWGLVSTMIFSGLKIMGGKKITFLIYKSARPKLVALAADKDTKFNTGMLEICDEFFQAATGYQLPKDEKK